MKQKNYVAYLRQSTVKQEVSGLGVEAQREIIRNYLKDRKTVAEYIETESGRKSDRPKLAEALELCRKTNSVLIVAKLDRLSRNVAFTSKLLESDVEIVFCDFPEANKLVLHIISSIAEYEAGLISQRTKQSLKAKKSRGYKLGKSENLLNKRKRLLNYILCIRFFIEVHSIVSASRFFHMPTYLRVVIECQSRFFPFFPAFSRNCPDYFLHTSGSSSFRSLSDLGAR